MNVQLMLLFTLTVNLKCVFSSQFQDLLQVPYDEKDTRMHELMRVAHKFLQNFCLGNQQNQILLHKQLDMFLNPGILDAETVCSIFKDNLALCSEVNEKVVQHFVHSIEIHGRHVEYLQFLQTIVKAENQFIRKCQDMVMQEVSRSFNSSISNSIKHSLESHKQFLFVSVNKCRRRCACVLQ